MTGKICKKRYLLVSSPRKWAWKCDFNIELEGKELQVLYEPFYFYCIKTGTSCKVFYHPKHPEYVVPVSDFLPEVIALLFFVLGSLFLSVVF